MGFCGIHLRPISKEIIKKLFRKRGLKMRMYNNLHISQRPMSYTMIINSVGITLNYEHEFGVW